MCDMQKMPSREDASCDEEADMNFTAFQAVSGAGTHFVTTGGQLPVTKIQQNVNNNGTTLQQVVGMGMDGVQYVRALDGGATLQATPQLMSVPIALPGAKPGDPQPTIQIQVLNPNMLQQQQPKYTMQIPIQGLQGFQQVSLPPSSFNMFNAEDLRHKSAITAHDPRGGAVLTLAYSPEAAEAGGIQILGNTLPEGLQVLMPQDMQLVQPQAQQQEKEQQPTMHQVFITPNQQIVINSGDNKLNNNTTNNNNNSMDITNIVIKEECDDNMNDDESSQGTEASDSMSWQSSNNHADLIKYLNTLPPQQTQALPVALQQFLRLNPGDGKKAEDIEIEVGPMDEDKKEIVTETVFDEDGTIRIQAKKKKKYKKKPPKPARPKPGQVVIAQASDGTPIYCCPECQMAYPEKEQLEMHLIVHKIERRFICGICGAGLKRKEHLERHKLGHNPERPYVCGVCRKGFKRREHLNLHTVIHSGVKTELCGECGKGFYRKDHLRKHTRSHESKRARDEAQGELDIKPAPAPAPAPCPIAGPILPEITIHVPTSANMQVPVQINIPPHVVSSLSAAQAASDVQAQLDALLAQHS